MGNAITGRFCVTRNKTQRVKSVHAVLLNRKKVSVYVLMQATKFKKKRKKAKRMFTGRTTIVFSEILGVLSTPASWWCCLGDSLLIIFFVFSCEVNTSV